MLDPNIILRGQQQQADPFESAAKGIQFGQGLRQLLSGRQAGKMAALAPEERQAFANKSMFSRELNAQLKADEAAQAQALREQQKHDADIYNTLAHGGERIANAGKTTQETTVNRQRAMSSALAAAMRGDPRAANFMLEHGKTGGIIDDASYEQAKQFLTTNANNPEAISSLVESLGVAAAEKPEQYIQPDANTVANNITSRANNEATVGATLAGQQVQKEIANDKLEFDKSQTSALFTTQQQDIKDGKAKLEVINGVTYLDYGNGRGEIYVDKNGQPMKPVSSTKPESRTETIERKEKAQNFAAASRSAADGATLAASILKRYQALNYNPVQFAAASRIPGSEAYNIVRDTETLKSNIFLARAGDMRGLGALTESEGAKLENSFGSLDPSQGNQFITNLGNIAQQFSSIAKNNANKTGLYMGRDGNVVQTTQKPAATAETKPPSPKGLTMSLSEVKQAAQGAGISTEQAVQQLRSQGVIIK